ncbi:transketolase [Thiospirochaeta perfilievii]|uniref:Transketolase n=1 Tax=Thiospirochaeta perfilievii TaxID=252967 RepID=A0A5C1QH27_9SPIO|nr:transketolase [Thiospirochaeta perfilievii]
MNLDGLKASALSVRALSMDAIQDANSGHPGLPLGCADMGSVLFGEILKHNPANSSWDDRDRFVLSAGHGSMLLYSLLHLTGYKLSLDDIKNFRQLNSLTPGHPEYGHTDGVETTTGPLGAGFSNAVGMAMAETMMAKKFNTDEFKIVDHYTYALSGDGCLMEGITAEAASLAGNLELGKLIVLYDSNQITIEGSTDITFTEDVLKRFEAYGWQTLEGDGHNLEEVYNLINQAKAESKKPTLIKLNTQIGFGSPNKSGTAGAHGAPLGPDEIKLTREALGIDLETSYYISPIATNYFEEKRAKWAKAEDEWNSNFKLWADKNPELKIEWDNFKNGKGNLDKIEFPEYNIGDKVATRSASGNALNAIAKVFPSLIGGSADLGPSNNSVIKGEEYYTSSNRSGRNIHFGVREHAMAGVVNGLVLHGYRAFCATFLVFSDYMRPAMRIASLMNLPGIYVLTHDSIYVGEDGPTHQPIEHYAALRIIPGMQVFRPGDAQETNIAWLMAVEEKRRPTSLLLTRQNITVYKKDDENWMENIKNGAYTVKDVKDPEVIIVATGSEVNVALEAAKLSTKRVKVISMLSKELFLQSPLEYRTKLLPSGVRVVTAESGVTTGWESIATDNNALFGIDRFGISGPGDQVANEIGLTPEKLLGLL